MVIVDTTVWIDYLRGAENPETDWLNQEMPTRRIGLTDLILCEVLQGIRQAGTFLEIRDELLSRFHVHQTGGSELAVAAAQNYRSLREHGYTARKTIDCVIATFCLRMGYQLLHRDRDFDAFERFLGLRVGHIPGFSLESRAAFSRRPITRRIDIHFPAKLAVILRIFPNQECPAPTRLLPLNRARRL